MGRLPSRVLVADYAGHPFQSQLSRAMARRGVEVRHVFAGQVGGPKGDLSADGAALSPSFVSLGDRTQDKSSAVSRVLAAVDFGRALGDEIESWMPEIVLAANVPPEGLISAGLGDPRITWVWWVQDLFALASSRTLKRRSKIVGMVASSFYSWAERRLASSAAGIVAIAESFLDYLPGEVLGKTSVIHNWAPIEEMPVQDRINRWACEHNVECTFNFMYTGTLALKHNPLMLVELASELRDDETVRVVLVSEGPGADFVAQEGQRRGLHNLRVLPFQPYHRLPEVMASADVLLALLERDAGTVAVPSKVLSYLCAARPVLAAIPTANLAAEILRQSGAGIVVAEGDRHGFCSEGRRLLAAHSDRQRMGAAGRTFAEEHFRIDSICEAFLEILSVS